MASHTLQMVGLRGWCGLCNGQLYTADGKTQGGGVGCVQLYTADGRTQGVVWAVYSYILQMVGPRYW